MPNTTRLVCPVCGASFTMPEHSFEGSGTIIGRDSNLGTIELQLDGSHMVTISNDNSQLNMESDNTIVEVKETKPMFENTTLNTIAAAGIDTSKYFTIYGHGNETLLQMSDNGSIDSVDANSLSVLERDIMSNGYVRNTKLFRRWITAQTLRALNHKDGYSGYIKSLGYNYMWKMTLEEVRVLSILEEKDTEAFNERKMFFNKQVVCEMLRDYISKLKKRINDSKTHKCKGVLEYKKLPYPLSNSAYATKGCIWNADLYRLYFEIDREYAHICRIVNYRGLYLAFKRFINLYVIRMPHDTKLNPYWVNAFEGAGAWYTLQNLVRFHGIRLENYHTGELYTDQTSSEKYLEQLLYTDEHYRYRTMALLKKVVSETNFKLSEHINDDESLR